MAVPSPGQVLPPPHKPTRITELPFSSKILRSSFWPEILDSILAVKHGFSLRRREKPPQISSNQRSSGRKKRVNRWPPQSRVK